MIIIELFHNKNSQKRNFFFVYLGFITSKEKSFFIQKQFFFINYYPRQNTQYSSKEEKTFQSLLIRKYTFFYDLKKWPEPHETQENLIKKIVGSIPNK